MASHMRISRAGLELIKQFEGYRPHDQELPDGRFIIGYGHVRAKKAGERLSKAEAEAVLREHDLPKYELLVENSVLAPLTQNEFDALVSFAFNIGAKPFVRSDVVAYLNSGNRLAAASAMDVWRKARIGGRVQVIDALVRRRAAEKALFLTSVGATPSAASVLYRPLSDQPPRITPPKKAREIIVERVSPAASETDADKTDSDETDTESLRKTIQDILKRGETESDQLQPANDQDGTDGASPEEIEAAIMDLAGQDQDAERVTKSMWPPREHAGAVDEPSDTSDESDLPPPPYLERIVTQPEQAARAPRVEREPSVEPALKLIDDLEEPEIFKPRAGMNGIGDDVRLQEPLVEQEPDHKGLSAAPYGLLSLIGAAIAGYGLADFFGLVRSGETVESDMAVYLPPFLILLGVMLFVVMGYYFLRTLFSKD